MDWFLIEDLRYILPPLLWAMGITLATRGFLSWLQSYYLLRAHMALAITTSGHFFWHILRLPTSFFDQRFAGEIGGRVALNNTVASILTGRLAKTCVHLSMIACYGVILFTYEYRLTLVGIGMAVSIWLL